MKKLRKLISAVTSILLFTCMAASPVYSDAAVVSDNTRAQIEASSESVYVTIDITYDNGMKAAIKKETNTKVAELSKKHFSEMDTSMYDEFTLSDLESRYENEIRPEVYDEVYNKAVHESIDPYLEEIGVEPGKDVKYVTYGRVECYLNEDQLEKAEKHSRTDLISVKEDYKNGVYIGNPDPYQIPGTTATFSATPSTTTSAVSTTQAVTTTFTEINREEWFTDTIIDRSEYRIVFALYGQYYMTDKAVRDAFVTYDVGDEVTIGMKTFIQHYNAVPRIDEIIMLEGGKIDVSTVTTSNSAVMTTPVSTETTVVTTQECDGRILFTDTITEKGDTYIVFEKHGKYGSYYPSVKEAFSGYNEGDEITIGIKWGSSSPGAIKVISDIFMLERGKVDPSTTTATTTTTQTTATKASTTTTTTVPTTQTTTTPTTTAETSTTEIVTTLEYTGTDMFTDTVKDIDDSTVTFSDHGQYRFLSADIREQFDSFVIGDEITIGFEYTKVNDTDTPRIDKIVMLSKTKPDIGDVNQDGKIDARDASDILKYYAENSVNTQIDQIKAQSMSYYGDLNDDGKTDAKDASDVLAIYASNSTQPSDESKVVWTETEPGEQVEYSSVYKIFDRDKYIGQTKLAFNGTVTDIKEYAVSGQYENGEKWGPSNRTIIEVAVNDVYYGETNKKTIKLFYNTSLSTRPKGSFMIETGREYFFIAKELDDNAVQNLDAAKYADLTITAGLRDGIMPVSDGIVSVYHEYFDDNETAKAEALAKDEVMDKLTDDAKAANWFMYFNKADFVELFDELFSSRQ